MTTGEGKRWSKADVDAQLAANAVKGDRNAAILLALRKRDPRVVEQHRTAIALLNAADRHGDQE